MRTLSIALVAIAGLGACGDDSGGAQGQPGAPGAPPPPAAAAANKAKLVPQVHVEDRVTEQEKSSIRHQFRDRDFDPNVNRDPFASLAMGDRIGTDNAGGTPPPVVQVGCKSELIAANYSYADLKLVGIVAQGTQRKVLMMDPGNLGRIIKAGDCVGKEKAVVKEIGTGYLTFQIVPDVQPGQTPRPEEHSIPLHEKDLEVTPDLSQPSADGPVMTPVLPNAPQPNPNVRPQPGQPVNVQPLPQQPVPGKH